METNATPDEGSQRRPVVPLGHVKDPQETIYVVATTVHATTHALDVAGALAREQGKAVKVLVSAPVHITITSARAGVYNLPFELPEAPGRATPGAVQNLVARERRPVDVVVTDAHDARGFAKVLPLSAAVVVGGPIHHFVETREQRLTRQLVTMGYDVIFLPCADEWSSHSPRPSWP
jgi:hypothetical protein